VGREREREAGGYERISFFSFLLLYCTKFMLEIETKNYTFFFLPKTIGNMKRFAVVIAIVIGHAHIALGKPVFFSLFFLLSFLFLSFDGVTGLFASILPVLVLFLPLAKLSMVLLLQMQRKIITQLTLSTNSLATP